MKILQFHAENIKKLSVVSITPTGEVVELVGPNGSGKSSCLDAIWWALAGKSNVQAKPIKKGETRGLVTLEVGDTEVKFRITRTFELGPDGKDFTTKLIVETGDGFKAKAPQDVLDALYSALSLDPLEFARAAPASRIKTLKAVVATNAGMDFAEIDRKRLTAFTKRTEIGRDVKSLQARADAIVVPEDAPTEIIDTAPFMQSLADIGKQVKAIEDERRLREIELSAIVGLTNRFDSLTREAAQHMLDIDALSLRIDQARADAKAAENEAVRTITQASERQKILDAQPPLATAPDPQEFQTQIEEAQRVNAIVVRAQDKARLAQEAADAIATQAQITADIDALDKTVRDAIAETKLPVRGLAIGEEDVELDGVPFDQASDAQQLRASMAIAMAMKPKLRIIRIRDASLLDKAGFDVICEVAKADGWQIWAESVLPHTSAAIHLEDGMVRE